MARTEQQREWYRKKRATDPAWVEKQLEQQREYRREKRATDPAWVERKRERGRRNYATDPAWVERERERERRNYATVEGRAGDLTKNAARRARKKGIPHTITAEWVAARLAPLRCEATGITLDLSAGATTFNSPSLDQRVAGGGYTPENTRVVCWAWNSMCGTWGDDVVDAILEARLAFRRGT